jgi:hypothetical protein
MPRESGEVALDGPTAVMPPDLARAIERTMDTLQA